jgi:HSP20 family protein
MALVKVNPLFAELAEARERLNRIFGRDELLETDGVLSTGDWSPSVDIIESDNEVTIKAELPGVAAKDISVNVDNNVLTLKGERRMEKEVRKEHYHRMERSYGSFSRSFSLPSYVDAAEVKAEHKDGLLTLRLPKKPAARGRKIEVSSA